ncbi:MAG: Mur ligase family protein, partial [bacterium]|nr:Mur ligase family protein [bacterium]
ALERGAAGLVVERPLEAPQDVAVFQVSDALSALQRLATYWRARHDIRVIGVTGSVGKTTCKELIAAVLGARYRVLKSPDNLNTEIGLPLTLLYLSEEHERAVLEMASALGWHGYHQRPAWTSRGYRTALQGHPGFPDLVLVHNQPGSPILFVEAKTDTGRLTPPQELWLDLLGQARGHRALVWRPSAWAEIEKVLRGEA